MNIENLMANKKHDPFPNRALVKYSSIYYFIAC